jgi:hypothetical protein
MYSKWPISTRSTHKLRVSCAPRCPLARAVVSVETLPAGLEVEFDLVFIPPTGDGVRVRRKVRLVIDGDQVLAVRLADETDPFSVEIELDT